MSNPWDELETFIRERRERDTAAQERSETRELFEGLNTKVDALAESLTKLAERSTSGVPPADDGTSAPPAAGSSSGGSASGPPSSDTHGNEDGGNTSEDELPLEHVRKLDVPRIYTGDDEPSEVSYIDPDSGETRKRKGRRKGRVAVYAVDPYEPPAPDEEVAS